MQFLRSLSSGNIGSTAMKTLLITAFLFAFAGFAYAHSGGTDSNGCHHDHKKGGYHCHNKKG
ncbi:YHYH domain-containing protein [Hahella aquimaris]|uniref:YHYH domain-containing protein n=1 Tax=Hahella sp. HNIBRBA332 TaxID=3015983 RepID=UPI00352EC9E4